MPDPIVTLDVKDNAAASSTTADVKPTEANPSVASTATEKDVKPKTMAEAIAAALPPKDSSSEAETGDKETPDREIQELNPTEKAETDKKETEKPTEKETEEVDTTSEDESQPVPYERFKEVNEKSKSLEGQLEAQKTFVEAHQQIENFCQSNNLNNDDFVQALEIAALLKRDPLSAWEKHLKPIVDGINVLRGEKLPDDLQEAVTKGDMTLDFAKRLAMAEAQKTFNANKSKLTEQQTAYNAQQRLVSDTSAALNVWQGNAQKNDPSYKPKAKSDAPDGLYELTNKEWFWLMQQNPPKTPNDAVALAEKAYRNIKASLSSQLPKPPTKKVLSSTLSSTSSNNGKPKTMLDAVRQHLATT